jgi:uncharacterized protein (TIGR03437 family)
MKRAVALAIVCFAGTAQVRFLPRGGFAKAIASDRAGVVYTGGTQDGHAFVARLSAAGEPRVIFSGVTGSGIADLTVAPDGNLYAAGGDRGRAVVWKLDTGGTVLYRAELAGPVSPVSIAVNVDGEALVGGTVQYPGEGFVATPGAAVNNADAPGFLMKLDRAGSKALLALRGIGGGRVAFDAAGDLYVAGMDWMSEVPITPGAFQSKHIFQNCGGSGLLGLPCAHQYLAKISGDGTKLLYSTFVTGSSGATVAGLAIDADGNALVAGYTRSNDYPVTAGAYQTEYRVTDRAPYVPAPHGYVVPPPATGYLTKVNRDGTGLVWSTFFSGTGSDTITSLAVDADGRITVAGLSGSRDLPGGQAVPDRCAPGLAAEIPFIAQLSPEGARLLSSRFVFGLDPNGAPMAAPPDGQALVVAGETSVAVDLVASTGLACAFDPADFARIAHAAPGQLISFGGDELVGASVEVGGVPAAVLYTARDQINLRVPPEVADRDVVDVTVTTANGVVLTRPLRVVPRAASAFLDIAHVDRVSHVYSWCGLGGSYPADPPVARNEDGSLNSCDSPAKPGSTIALFLNGLGATAPVGSLKYPQDGTVVAVEQDPDSPAGVWRMRIKLPENVFTQTIVPLLDDAPLRNAPLAIWVARP